MSAPDWIPPLYDREAANAPCICNPDPAKRTADENGCRNLECRLRTSLEVFRDRDAKMRRDAALLAALRASRDDHPYDEWIAKGIAALEAFPGAINTSRAELVMIPHIAPNNPPVAITTSGGDYRFAKRWVSYFDDEAKAPSPEDQWVEFAMFRASAAIMGAILYPDPRAHPDLAAQETKGRVRRSRVLKTIKERDARSGMFEDVEGGERMTLEVLKYLIA